MRFQADENYVKVLGRTIFRDGVRYLGYSGTSVTFRFYGKHAETVLWSNCDQYPEDQYGWVAVFVNGATEPTLRICLKEKESTYTLYQSDEAQEVEITIMKYTEAQFAVCGIKELIIDTEQLLEPPMPCQRKIYVVGDSISCGYGIEDPNNSCVYRSSQENPYHAYAMQTAKNVDADLMLLGWNGKGIVSNYVEDQKKEPYTELLMTEQYDYTDASCCINVFGEKKDQWERWDYNRFHPDLVILFLGTNDGSYCRDISERREAFGKAYEEFVYKIQKTNPGAKILCMLGNVDQRLCETVRETVSRIGDDTVTYVDLPPMMKEDGLGTNFHPSEKSHVKLTCFVTREVRKVMGW